VETDGGLVDLSPVDRPPDDLLQVPHWTAQSSGTMNDLTDVVLIPGGGGVCVVGRSGAVVFSDGKQWTSVTSGTGQDLHSIGGVGALFAVGANGTILQSSDCKTWTPRSSGTN